MIDLSFTFTSECWRWQTTATAWFFISLPQNQSDEIKFFSQHLHEKRRGWGAVRVQVTIGKTTWKTSIFPDAKSGCYLLPIKASVRKAEKICVGDALDLKLDVTI